MIEPAEGPTTFASGGDREASMSERPAGTVGEAKKASIDPESYAEQLLDDNRAGRCFICELVSDASDEHVIYKDELCIALLPKYPTLRGRALLAPIEHRTQVV